MSGGRSFHSVSGRVFWKDWPGVLRLLPLFGSRLGEGWLEGGAVAGRDLDFEGGGGGGIDDDEDGKFAAAAVTLSLGLGLIVVFSPPSSTFALRRRELLLLSSSLLLLLRPSKAPRPISRRTIHALSGRSL